MHNFSNPTPIKVADPPVNKQSFNVVTGNGISAAIAAIQMCNQKIGRSTSKGNKAWCALLDSGSNGDLLTIRTKDLKNIPHKNRHAPERYETSNGTFKTTKVGRVDVLFPEFSSSKIFSLTPDIIEIEDENAREPMFDLIIGTETLAKFGVVLDFTKQAITVDKVENPMRPLNAYSRHNRSTFAREELEPISTRDQTSRAVEYLDAQYEKADLTKVIHETASHLTAMQQGKLLALLSNYEELFDGTLGDFQTDPVKFNLQLGAKPYHTRPYPIPQSQLRSFKKEVDRLESIGVLKRQPTSEWGSPAFGIQKKDGSMRFLFDCREVNKRLVRTPFPLPKISNILQEMEGFTFATALDLNMGYYTIRLDPDAQKICTIVLPWGKYSYLRLPMGIAGAPDIFQEKMSDLMRTLEYVRTYLDDLLCISNGTFQDHLNKVEVVLQRLQKAKLRVNLRKSQFALHEVEYLGYVLTRDGIKPHPGKVSAILALKEPSNVKELRRFLGMVQYYRDVWEKRSEMVAPLTDLVGEVGHTKVTKKNKTKKKAWYWDKTHQEAFDAIKKCLSREVILAYPNYGEEFQIYTDASTRQLGAVITQYGKPLAFFSRKLSEAQRKYTVTELELLSIVECLKEFKGMLWGQKLKVFTDHKNLVKDALGLTCDRVHRWRLLLEEYNPEIEYIKGSENIVADAISRLDYDEKVKHVNVHLRSKALAKLFNGYVEHTHGGESYQTDYTYVNNNDVVRDFGTARANYSSICRDIETSVAPLANQQQVEDSFKYLFANNNENRNMGEEIFPVTVSEIADAQKSHNLYKKYFKDKPFKKRDSKISSMVVTDTNVLMYNKKRLVIPTAEMQNRILDWYHHYLQHPGESRMEETLVSVMYWSGMRVQIRKYVKTCDRCQKAKRHKRKYGKIPPKLAVTEPWKQVCVDLIGPYTVKGADGTVLDFMCLTMIDPATSWFEIVELPNRNVEYVRDDGKEVVEVKIDKTSNTIARLFNKSWLSRYPRANSIVYDNGSEFKLFFENLCDEFTITRKPTIVKNPQANAVLERVHAVVTNIIRTSGIDMSPTCTPEMVDDIITNVGWAIRSTYHTVIGSSPGAAIFGRDMLFDIPYIADWLEIGKARQKQVDRSNELENSKRIDYDYKIGDKALLIKDGIFRKAEDNNDGPYLITQVFSNGTVRIQRGTINERLNIRRLRPYFER